MADTGSGSELILDIDALLAPIPGGRRVGLDLREDDSDQAPFFLARRLVQEARVAERSAIAGSLGGSGDRVAERRDEWRRARESCEALLRGTSKDIEVVTWLVEALLRLHGIAGLRVGLDLTARFVDKYWSDMHYLVDPDDPDAKGWELTSLANRCLDPAGRVALLPGSDVHSPLSYFMIEQMRTAGRLGELQAAARVSGEDFFRTLMAAVQESIRLCDRIDSIAKREVSEYPPSMGELKQRLAEIGRSLVAVSGAFFVAAEDDPYFIDLPTLLAPLPGGSRVGVNLRGGDGRHTVLHEIRMLRQAALEAEKTERLNAVLWAWMEGEDQDQEKWLQIKARCVDILQNTSKDIEVVGLLTEALVRLHGMAGLYRALQFVARFLKAYWDDMHHPVDPEDPEVTKELMLVHLDGRLGASVPLLPVTPRLIGNEPLTFEALQPSRAWHDPTREAWNIAQATVEAVGTDFYQPLFANFRGAKREWQSICDLMDARLGVDGSPLYLLRQVLGDMERTLRRIAPGLLV